MYATTDLDQEKQWLRDATSGDEASGVGDPLTIPREIDTPYFRDAMNDPAARPYVLEILGDPNPIQAFDKQSEADLSEAVHPTGKVIVFKALVAPIAARLQRVSQAITDSLPTANTDEGRLSIHIANTDPNAEKELTDYYTHIAFEAFDPQAYDQVTEDDPSLMGYGLEGSPFFGYNSHVAHALGALGLSKKWRKRLRRIKKVATIVGVAAAAVVATVFTGGAAMGAMAAVAGVAGTALKTFGHTKAQKRIGGYLQTGAAVAGAAAAVVGAAGAISNAVSSSTPAAPSGSAPAPAPAPVDTSSASSAPINPPPEEIPGGGMVTSIDQSAPEGPGLPSATTSIDESAPSGPGLPGAVTQIDSSAPAGPGVPGAITSMDQTAVDQSAPAGSPGGGGGSLLQAAGAVSSATGAVLHAVDASQQPTGGSVAGSGAPGQSQAGVLGGMGAALPLGLALVAFLALSGGSKGGGSRRNPPRRRKGHSRRHRYSRR